MTDPLDTIDATRPLLLGYVRAHILMTEVELADTKERLACFAGQEGFTLGKVYVERIDRAPAAFHALVEAVQRDGAEAVVVPSMHHFAVLGSPASTKQYLEHHAGVRVLIAHTPP